MRGRWGDDLDIDEYLDRLPDQGRCLTSPVGNLYITEYTAIPEYIDPGLPRIMGIGPVECSTCTDLVPLPEIIWDVNHYYRSLGFSFPYQNITRKELRLNFLKVGGPNDERLMYVMTQLVDKQVRFLYDCAPLGSTFMDRYIQDALKKKALREALHRNVPRDEDGTVSSEEIMRILKEWGIDVVPQDENEDGEEVDGKPAQEEVEESSSVSSSSATVTPWRWSYYSWRTRESDMDRLQRWQQLLIANFARRNMRIKFAVGYFGKQPHRYVRSLVDGRIVFLLHEDREPTDELAAFAVEQEIYTPTKSDGYHDG